MPEQPKYRPMEEAELAKQRSDRKAMLTKGMSQSQHTPLGFTRKCETEPSYGSTMVSTYKELHCDAPSRSDVNPYEPIEKEPDMQSVRWVCGYPATRNPNNVRAGSLQPASKVRLLSLLYPLVSSRWSALNEAFLYNNVRSRRTSC